ncbi:hypothetical protein AWC38_SpisGene7509 [Stylophora pistillata]|uniref:DUF5641 domain-containing protein n=1 Tax=Stylophora pistillata TaxID=50429 RepID=A0A2B4SGL8_STYPI|nr:hypothetical protein AWC38_SpisGene7509 [Stylophora pistillata]
MEYRMNVHLFGNGPSPAVATFGLRKTAADGEEEFGEEAKKFVCRNFYVDDGLASTPTPQQAISLVTNTQAMLAKSNLRLHKVISNSVEVMEAFPLEHRGKDIRDLDLRQDSLPTQRSLGVYWDLTKDAFTFKVCSPRKSFTRRGVLSVVNAVYDPLGLAVPVLLEGKLLLQQLVSMGRGKNNNATLGWDDPLPDNFGRVAQAELHAFSDASKDAIGACVYLRLVNDSAEVATPLVFGQSKVAPLQTTSILRLELCGAVLATQGVARILKELDETKIETFVTQHGCKWKFNPPHASHFGSVWERQIGTIRRVLDAMLAELGPRQLTHEILSTFIAEVTAIVNARPIAALPSDINDPQPLSPAMLLTMKTRPPGPPPGNFLPPDLYANRRWRRVQYLADQFWLRWRREYLQNLQPRRKWYDARRDLAPGDVVLMNKTARIAVTGLWVELWRPSRAQMAK